MQYNGVVFQQIKECIRYIYLVFSELLKENLFLVQNSYIIRRGISQNIKKGLLSFLFHY